MQDLLIIIIDADVHIKEGNITTTNVRTVVKTWRPLVFYFSFSNLNKNIILVFQIYNNACLPQIRLRVAEVDNTIEVKNICYYSVKHYIRGRIIEWTSS